MKWKHPPIIKIYEALGSITDDRVEVSGNMAKVYSSSRNKFYDVVYDPVKNEIMTNDNGSFWKGYLGYPAIAYLMKIDILSYDATTAELLKNISWKDINQKFKNDFDKTLAYIWESKSEEQRKKLENLVDKIEGEIRKFDFGLLGTKKKPPEGY